MNTVIELATNKFKLDINSTHGLPHWQRVAKVGAMLAALNGANAKVVEQFAYLHDACRLDEWDDPEHAKRASDWVDELWLDGAIDLTIEEHVLLSVAIAQHTHGHTCKDPTIGTCFDADRLDLWRVGIMPAERFLCTQAAKDMLVNMQTKA